MQPAFEEFDLLSRIPLSARTLLHVGCSDDGLVAAYRSMNPRARILGLVDEIADVERAGQMFDQVAAGDLEADRLPFDIAHGVDCIIYNNVLEHLKDPWAVISRHRDALSADGIMVICQPNIDYWQLTEQRLRGSAAPDARFTVDDMQDGLRNAGLTICDVISQEPDPEAASWFADALEPALLALEIDADTYRARCAASHFIWRVRKNPSDSLIVAGTMLLPVGGVSDVRVVYPLRALATDPSVTAEVTDYVSNQPPTDTTPRVFVLHRPALMGEEGLALVRRLMAAGYVVVTEFDDHPDHFKMMQLGGELSFTGVHALQTSTTALAEVLRKYNPEIAVFPNAMMSLPEVRNFADPDAVTLFFGALNREKDWRPLLPAINMVARLAGARLKFQVVHDRMFFDALDTPHKAFTPTCDYEAYMSLLASCEISFMPLGDTAFNRAKSDLKFIEASACRVATLASTVVYGNSIQHGHNGLLFRDPEAFHAHLLRLVAMPELARGLADNARAYVAEHRMLAYQVAPRAAWYRSLWARRDSLTQAMLSRAPKPDIVFG